MARVVYRGAVVNPLEIPVYHKRAIRARFGANECSFFEDIIHFTKDKPNLLVILIFAPEAAVADAFVFGNGGIVDSAQHYGVPICDLYNTLPSECKGRSGNRRHLCKR